MREHIRKVIACIKAPPDVPQEGMGGRDTGAALPQRTSAYVLDQLLAGGLLGSPRSSLEKSEHARLSTNPQASISSGQRKHPQAPQAAEQALEARPDRAGPPAVLTPADLEDGPTPLMSAFASAPASAEPVFTCPEQPLPRLNVARASTDSALDIPGLLPSAFASVAYADAFNSPRWSSRVEAQREQPAPAVDLQHIELSLPGIPVQHACPCNTQVSITPTLWRHFEPPFRLMVHLGIHTTLVEGEMTLPLGIYSSLNPRVVTTGRNCSLSLPQVQPVKFQALTMSQMRVRMQMTVAQWHGLAQSTGLKQLPPASCKRVGHQPSLPPPADIMRGRVHCCIHL